MPGLTKKDKRRKQPRARRPGCFEVQERAGQLAKMGGPRVGWKARIDWEAFRPELERVHDKARKSAAGAKLSDIVSMTTYHTDLSDFKTFTKVQREFIPTDFPAHTAVGVSALMRPAFKCEIAVIAVVGSGGSGS